MDAQTKARNALDVMFKEASANGMASREFGKAVVSVTMVTSRAKLHVNGNPSTYDFVWRLAANFYASQKVITKAEMFKAQAAAGLALRDGIEAMLTLIEDSPAKTEMLQLIEIHRASCLAATEAAAPIDWGGSALMADRRTVALINRIMLTGVRPLGRMDPSKRTVE